MSRLNSDIQELEAQIDKAERLVDRRKRALRLSENPDFKLLFTEGYFRDEAAQFVALAGDPAMTKDQREDALAMALATGHCKRYVSVVIRMGEASEDGMETMRNQLEELRSWDEQEYEQQYGEYE